MPARTEYTHGTPSWVDLMTTDVDAAKATRDLGYDEVTIVFEPPPADRA